MEDSYYVPDMSTARLTWRSPCSEGDAHRELAWAACEPALQTASVNIHILMINIFNLAIHSISG